MSSSAVDAPADAGFAVTRRPWLVLALTCAAQFMGVLDVTIVNVALPSMRDSLHLSEGGLQWVVSGYALTFAGFLLLGGRAADLLGLERVFLAGLAVFTAASLAGGVAEEGWQLVVARVVQGLGGAVLTPATLTMVTTAFTGSRERARALGIWSAVSGAGGALGGVIGGLLTGLLSWRWVLMVNVPIGVVLLLVGGWTLRGGHRPRTRAGLDLPGSVTVTGGTACLVGGIVAVPQEGWRSATSVALLAGAVVLLSAFVGVERAAANPLVPLAVLRIRSLSVANVLSLVTGGVVPATFFFMSLYLQQIRGLDPLGAGLAMVPAAVGIATGSVLASRLLACLGSRVLYLMGAVTAACGLLWLTWLDATGSYAGQVAAPLFLAMLGTGLGGLPLTMAATADPGPGGAGLASGLLNTSRQVGGAVGLAALVSLAATRTARESAHPAVVAQLAGYRLGWLWCAVVVLLAGVIGSLTLPREARTQPGEADEARST
ncbi:MFS transporter [Streptomyces griseorubiginosus]|uniref:MFS transporter n=1 Tax=Streptomyces griseorubiginosus TaxID=67304 RepID=UPI0036325C1A